MLRLAVPVGVQTPVHRPEIFQIMRGLVDQRDQLRQRFDTGRPRDEIGVDAHFKHLIRFGLIPDKFLHQQRGFLVALHALDAAAAAAVKDMQPVIGMRNGENADLCEQLFRAAPSQLAHSAADGRDRGEM